MKTEMKKGKTLTGFEFEIDANAVDDYDVVNALIEIDAGDFVHLNDTLTALLGADQFSRLKEHVKELDGRTTFSGIMREFSIILQEFNEIKN